ncbi:hypothetical protein [Sphingobacterium endophyticum]|uniref:hypothetical protein n=1 Tax=Sphingobacterium endophyticum TaxID=2546448 RepID=UPI0012E2BB3B|nr:hypothetical protein [Sphingobacterium endophyticum]
MKRNRLTFILPLLLLAASLTGCGKDQAENVEPKPEGGDITAGNVSYSNYVGKLLESRCNSCHNVGGSGSSKWTFSGIESVKSNSDRIKNAVLVTMTMPMGSSLSAKEKELLDAWFKRNMP